MATQLGEFVGHLSDRRRIMGVTVVTTALLFGLFDFFADRLMMKLNVPLDVHAALQAAIVGMAAAGGMYLILLGNRERRRLVADELKRVEELNHTLRNSLQVILHAHYIEDDSDGHKQMIINSVQQIDNKLKELFPVLGVRQSH